MIDEPDPVSRGATWIPPLSPEERAAQLAHDEKLVNREVRGAFVGTLLTCGLSLVAGLGLMGLGLHLSDPATGQIAFFAGLVLGYTGIVIALARYYLRGEEEGWW